MATRGVFQLRKLTVKYCDYGGSSKGAREFIRHRIVDFAKSTPAAEIVTELRPGRHPYIMGDYETGESKAIGVKNISPTEIMDYAMMFRNSSGRKVWVRFVGGRCAWLSRRRNLVSLSNYFAFRLSSVPVYTISVKRP